MNTLPPPLTARLLGSAEAFEALEACWKRQVAAARRGERPPLTAAQHFLYLVVRGKDWRKAFPPRTSERHVKDGGLAHWSLPRVLHQIHESAVEPALLEPFEGTLTPAMLAQVRSILPQEAVYPGVCVYWPYDAYDTNALVALVRRAEALEALAQDP